MKKKRIVIATVLIFVGILRIVEIFLAMKINPLEAMLANTLFKKARTFPVAYPSNGSGISFDTFSFIDETVLEPLCKGVNISLVIPIYSATFNFERREAIRQTYGQTCKSFKRGCKLFFIIGADLNQTTFKGILNEYKEKSDILLIDKIDTYRDLNNKGVAMINWIDTFCPTASFVLHVIDDTYPNLQLIMNQLDSIHQKNFILGKFHPSGELTPREGIFKNTKEEYPNDSFPAYISGTALAFPMSTLKLLKTAIPKADYCWIEDVWLYGLVREMAGVEMIELKIPHQEEIPLDLSVKFTETSFYHRVTVNDFYRIHDISNRVL